MAHVKKQVRDAVKARLETVAGLSLVADESRIVRPFQSSQFPLALVLVSESIAGVNASQGKRVQTRALTIGIRIGVQDEADDVENTLDAIAVDVEKAFANPSDLGIGKLMQWEFAGSSSLSHMPVSDGTLLTVMMTYTCVVQTMSGAPETNLLG
jgi:hypothetical protein